MAINPLTGEEELEVLSSQEGATNSEVNLEGLGTNQGPEIDPIKTPSVPDAGLLGGKGLEGTGTEVTPTPIQGEDLVVDIDEEKKGDIVAPEFTEDSIIDIISKKESDKTEEDKALVRRFNAKKAFNLGKGLDAFGNPIGGAGAVAGTVEGETLLGSGELEDALGSVKNFNDAMARSALGGKGFTPSQIDQIMLRRGTQAAIGTKQEEVDIRLDTAKTDIENRGQQRMAVLDRGLSFSGFGRSSTAIQKRDELQSSINNEIRQAQAKADLEVQLFKAQQEGAEAETIASISQSLASATATLQETETENAIALAKANQELGLKAQEALDNFLGATAIADDPEFTGDIEKTREVGAGYFVDSNGDVVVGKDGKPIIYKQPEAAEKASKAPNVQFIAAKADDFGKIIQPSGYFNKDTQEFHPINYGGDTDQVEFQGGESIETPIAEYTQIYKGSPANPNGIDLAGKKGSAINTPVSGEVIFVGENGDWGNQVRIKDSSGQIHQFSHLDTSGLEEGQVLTNGAMVGTMGNTGNVLKGDGTVPTEEELAQGRGTHLDYTVYDKDDKVLGLDVAMAYAGIENTSGETSTTSEAVNKGYKTPSQIKVYNKILDEGGTPPDLAGKNLNEGQTKSVGFAKRMGDDLDVLKSKKDVIKGLGTLKLSAYRAAFGTTLGNQFVPPEVQQFLQAERDFIQAQLRKESGAAIPTSEIDAFVKTNGILPGDSDAVIEQKFNNMENMLESMIIGAGPGAGLIDEGSIPDGLDQDDVQFFGEEPQGGTFDLEDEEFFNNLD